MTRDAILAMQDFQILYRNSSIVQINELHITFISVRKLLFNYSYVKNNLYLMFLTFSMWTIFLGNTLLFNCTSVCTQRITDTSSMCTYFSANHRFTPLGINLDKIPNTHLTIWYNIIRKTWKGMNQTKMEGGTERHLTQTDD